ncbi:GNAT family N-acetyltransferase [Winogradskyella psychrotolerans]|uniref:GNAT family N-acetyltransferase n=1 Tax=Winogradskyella psychrotolerans TaxID=1344585 RepID=UPI001C077C5E|nr:GNAT family N-acetyltransferase [Winogradskyella psychrotolerans]MBU2928575.1 GNAT family N-acetyltransferase [Winogradskyella psychrotolerans]
MKIEVCNKADIKTIVDGLNTYNLDKVAALSNIWTPLEYSLKNEDDAVVGGVLAGLNYWNGLEIKILWIEEDYRNQGLGRKLLNHLENEATRRGASIAMVDTFDFQAEGFYIKNNYDVIGEIKNFPKGHRRIYFTKILESKRPKPFTV